MAKIAPKQMLALSRLPGPPPPPELRWNDMCLSPRQQKFVSYYVNEAMGKARIAARLAGYGGSKTQISVRCCRLLDNPRVQHAISLEVGKRFGKPEDIKNTLAAITTANVGYYLKELRYKDDKGKTRTKMVVDLVKLKRHGALGLVESLEITPIYVHGKKVGEAVNVKMFDKVKAAETMAKIAGMMREPERAPAGITVNDPRFIVQVMANDTGARKLAHKLAKHLPAPMPTGATGTDLVGRRGAYDVTSRN